MARLVTALELSPGRFELEALESVWSPKSSLLALTTDAEVSWISASSNARTLQGQRIETEHRLHPQSSTLLFSTALWDGPTLSDRGRSRVDVRGKNPALEVALDGAVKPSMVSAIMVYLPPTRSSDPWRHSYAHPIEGGSLYRLALPGSSPGARNTERAPSPVKPGGFVLRARSREALLRRLPHPSVTHTDRSLDASRLYVAIIFKRGAVPFGFPPTPGSLLECETESRWIIHTSLPFPRGP